MGSVICNKHNDQSEHSDLVHIYELVYTADLYPSNKERSIRVPVRVDEELPEVGPRALVCQYQIYSTSSCINPKNVSYAPVSILSS